jgi:hypothetical protein
MDEMKTLTELGADLYPEQGPSPQMQTRAMGAPPRNGRLRLVITGAAAVVLAAGTALAVNSLTAAQAEVSRVHVRAAPPQVVEPKPVSFTVRTNADGSITFTATDLVDPAAATQALNTAGVAGRVVNIPNESCPIGTPNYRDLAPGYQPAKAEVGWQGASDSVTVRSTDYPPGGGLLLIVQVDVNKADGQVGVGMVVYPYTDVANIPACLRFAFGDGN